MNLNNLRFILLIVIFCVFIAYSLKWINIKTQEYSKYIEYKRTEDLEKSLKNL